MRGLRSIRGLLKFRQVWILFGLSVPLAGRVALVSVPARVGGFGVDSRDGKWRLKHGVIRPSDREGGDHEDRYHSHTRLLPLSVRSVSRYRHDAEITSVIASYFVTELGYGTALDAPALVFGRV